MISPARDHWRDTSSEKYLERDLAREISGEISPARDLWRVILHERPLERYLSLERDLSSSLQRLLSLFGSTDWAFLQKTGQLWELPRPQLFSFSQCHLMDPPTIPTISERNSGMRALRRCNLSSKRYLGRSLELRSLERDRKQKISLEFFQARDIRREIPSKRSLKRHLKQEIFLGANVNIALPSSF